MKKLILIALLSTVMVSKVCAETCTSMDVPLEVCAADDPYKPQPGIGRSVVSIPLFYLEENKLSFEKSTEPFLLYVYKESEVVFSQTVPSGASWVSLPSFLKGDYKLLVVYDEIAYSGDIILE